VKFKSGEISPGWTSRGAGSTFPTTLLFQIRSIALPELDMVFWVIMPLSMSEVGKGCCNGFRHHQGNKLRFQEFISNVHEKE